ncbi:MAG: hypothetical protein ABTA16_08245 [Niallia sp.]
MEGRKEGIYGRIFSFTGAGNKVLFFQLSINIYQPTPAGYQLNFPFISQAQQLFSQTSLFSAKPNSFSAKLSFSTKPCVT